MQGYRSLIPSANMKISDVIRLFIVLFVLASVGTLVHWGVFSVVPKWDTESTKYPEVVLGQTFNGIVLSMKDVRFQHTERVLATLGINVTQKIPPPFQSKEVDEGLEGFTGSRSFHTDTFLKVWSNRMAFIEAIEAFVQDSESGRTTWRFFFEDDIALHPSLSMEKAKLVLARGLAVASSDGIVFLGICGTLCGDDVQGLDKDVQANRCMGTCAHAFGFQQWKAAEFLTEMSGLTLSGPNPVVLGFYFDRYLYAFAEFVHKIWLLGSNLKSPVESVWDHFGLLYQDRTLFHSEISG